MKVPMTKIGFLRLAAVAVMVAALALSGWLLRQWPGVVAGVTPFDPHGAGSFLAKPWVSAAPLLVLLLANATGAALLLLAHAAFIERHQPTRHLQTEQPGQVVPDASLKTRFALLSNWLAAPQVMTTLATAIIASWVLSFLIAMMVPSVGLRTLNGGSKMIELVDVLGVLSLVRSWVVLVALLLISLSIAILLYANAEPFDRPKNGHPGSNEGR